MYSRRLARVAGRINEPQPTDRVLSMLCGRRGWGLALRDGHQCILSRCPAAIMAIHDYYVHVSYAQFQRQCPAGSLLGRVADARRSHRCSMRYCSSLSGIIIAQPCTRSSCSCNQGEPGRYPRPVQRLVPAAVRTSTAVARSMTRAPVRRVE